MSHPDIRPPASLSNPLAVALTARDRGVLSMVHDALAHRRIVLAFQPVVRASNPETVAFYEGLVRVIDRQGRIIPAREFIDVVEDQPLGRELDTLALTQGLAALASEPSLRLSINMSARSIGYAPWNQALRRGLAADPTAGERLILEITERTAITMPDIVQVFMADLQAKGISFAIDDFGAGYTALRYFRDLYFDLLKIDGSFIKGIHASADDQVLTRALLDLARHFDMFTVAEGVECWEDAEVLIRLGVDCLQGHFFGAPTIRPWWVAADPRDALMA